LPADVDATSVFRALKKEQQRQIKAASKLLG